MGVVSRRRSDGRVARRCFRFPNVIAESSSAPQGVSILLVSLSSPGPPSPEMFPTSSQTGGHLLHSSNRCSRLCLPRWHHQNWSDSIHPHFLCEREPSPRARLSAGRSARLRLWAWSGGKRTFRLTPSQKLDLPRFLNAMSPPQRRASL